MPSLTSHRARYIGRFAPSPTGPLHFGSLIAALASFLDARAHGGQWFVRIEDIDPAREIPNAAETILHCLRAHALEWDGDVLYQSRRTAIYWDACTQLIAQQKAFYCTCSRLDLTDSGGIYTGRCRPPIENPQQYFSRPQQSSQELQQPFSIRLRTEAVDIHIDDRIQPSFVENIARDVGDFVIYRKENLPAYQLAVIVDDAAQGVTHVVRGSDLLASTARQIFLQRCLQLPTPHYAHIPVIANSQHQKLSKQTFARELDNSEATENLLAALEFLQQPLPPAAQATSAASILQWAIRHWNIALVRRQQELCGMELPPRCQRFAS
jgi:glutamyl-Q tRNA(Asp) synthetase